MIKKLLLIFVLLSWGANIFSQKLPMKLDDCKQWHTIDKIDLSRDGRWVVYNYRMLYTESPDTVYLYNVKTGKTYIKSGISDFCFLAGGKYLKFNKKTIEHKADSDANKPKRPDLCLLNLSNMKEQNWTASSFLVPIGQSDYAYYSTYGANGKSDITFVNLLNGKEQKIENGNNCTMSGENSLMYTVKQGNNYDLFQWTNGTSIRIGETPCNICQIGQPEGNGKGILGCSSDV